MNDTPTNGRQPNIAGHYLAQIKQKLSHASTKYFTSSFTGSKTQSAAINVIDVNEFIKIELPKRENILSPWLPVQGLTMIYAPRGIGKTHIALGIAYSIV